jgi:hypothetical protein
MSSNDLEVLKGGLCDRCEQDKLLVARIPRPYDLPVYLCLDCLRTAVQMLDGQQEQADEIETVGGHILAEVKQSSVMHMPPMAWVQPGEEFYPTE